MKESYKENFLKAGELAGIVRSFGRSLIVQGASYQTVVDSILAKTKELGAVPAFPPQMAINDVAAHYLIPPGQDLIFQQELVKLDIGVCYEGAIGDCAVTVDLSGRWGTLIEAAEAALLAAERLVRPGVAIRSLGKVIEETIHSFGFRPIKNLTGHGLGYFKVHTPPAIPNYDDRSKGIIKPGMTFAIEPFATNGRGLIIELGAPTIFSQIALRAKLSPSQKPLWAKIAAFQGLPFSIHALLDEEFPLPIVEKTLEELLNQRAIAGYPPLVEMGKGVVAQAENSVLVDHEGHVFISTRMRTN